MDVDLLRRSGNRRVAAGLTTELRPPVFDSGEELPAAPRQARSRARRQQIVTAAIALFAERGYQATAIGDITSRADTAAGAFYIYFRSKRQLLIVLMNEFIDRLSRLDLRPQAGAAARGGLRSFLAAAFRADRQYYGVIRAWQESALTDPELAAMQKSLEAWTQARILGVFRLLQQHPHARSGCDLPAFARMMDRHFWSILARGAQLSPRDFDREVRIAADVIDHYLRADPSPSADVKIG